MGPSPTQLLIVLGVIVLLFGAGRLANVGRGLGEGISNFRKGLQGGADDDAPELPPADEAKANQQQA
jgi:sec-independent protein translocase protein TatA